MRLLKGMLKYFSKSSFGVAKLIEARKLLADEGSIKNLQSIGKTRFGTHWTACVALDPHLTSIRSLVIDKTIKFKVSTLYIDESYTNI